MSNPALLPWYRHRWPWLLMSGPAIVVVAGISTAIVAVRTSDGVVAEDYYKQGLAINRTLEREGRAKALGVAAMLQLNEEGTRVRVMLSLEAPQPAAVRLSLVHPTRAEADQGVTLAASAPGMFEGAIRAPAAGRWTVQLEDDAGTWRVACAWNGRRGSVMLSARPH
jgi:hypothetical protein